MCGVACSKDQVDVCKCLLVKLNGRFRCKVLDEVVFVSLHGVYKPKQKILHFMKKEFLKLDLLNKHKSNV